ncbi:MAG: peptide MFS transporter [Bradymonadaceae bacterium]
MSDSASADGPETFFGHPVGLIVLFFTELWERFSFYGMRALLVFYMTKQLMFSDEFSYGIYGAYGSLVYATPILGGLLADRLLGYRRAIILGAVLMALGHFAMTLDHTTIDAALGGMATSTGTNQLEVALAGATFSLDTTIFFYGALALLIVGNGFFKPNISSLVGRLYDEEGIEEAKRDGGFTIFYMGINIGALLAPLLCGYLGQEWGWHYGFGLAGVGMVTGLVIFVLFEHVLEGHGEPPEPEELVSPLWGFGLPAPSKGTAVYVGAFLSIPVIAATVAAVTALGTILAVVGVVVFGLLFAHAMRSEKVVRDRLFVILVLIFFSMTFWAFFEQAGSSINMFTDRNVDRTILGWTLPASVFQGVNPAFIILLAPVFAWIWEELDGLGWEPSTPVKFGMGLSQLALGFGALVLGGMFAGSDGMVPITFLFLGYLLHTTGELCLSPVGLSMVTKLSPKETVGVVMGAWFLSSSFAHYIAGLFAKLASPPKGEQVSNMAASETLPLYTDLFGTIALVAGGVAVLCFLLSPILEKWMHGVD